MSVADLMRHVDEHLPEYVERFQTYLRFPSVAAQNRAQDLCATWLRDQMIQAVRGGAGVGQYPLQAVGAV